MCIGVDDYGLHPGIARAALRLAGEERVHAIGCMVGAPSWRRDAAALRGLAPARIDVGLHFDLTEHPLRPANRRSLGRLIAVSHLHTLGAAALREEVRAQLGAFEDGAGRAPAFVDGHQHVHQFPVVREALLDELDRRYGQARPWLRSTRRRERPASRPGQPWREAVKPLVIELLGAHGLRAAARRRGYLQNEALLGVYGFDGGPDAYRRRLAGWLRSAHEGDLLMCHPSSATSSVDPMLEARRAEFEVLAGPGLQAMLDDAAIVLQPMSRILAIGSPSGAAATVGGK